MKIEKVIDHLLKNSTVLSSLVGTHIYPVVVPKGVEPDAVVVWRVISNLRQTTAGAAAGHSLWRARVQVDASAKSYFDYKTLVDAVMATLDIKSGVINEALVVSCLLDSEGAEDFDSGPAMYVQPLDFMIYYHD